MQSCIWQSKVAYNNDNRNPKPTIKFIVKYNNHTQQAVVKPLESIIYSKTEYSTLTYYRKKSVVQFESPARNIPHIFIKQI